LQWRYFALLCCAMRGYASQSEWNRYLQRPGVEHEEFAQRYAENAMTDLRRSGAVPFDRKMDGDTLLAEGLSLEDFQPEPESG